MSSKLFTVLMTVILFASCRKDDHQPEPLPVQEYEVTVTASLFNPANGYFEAAYFINGEKKILDAGGAQQAFPYGLTRKGQDLYIAGGFAMENASADFELLKPCYWKNRQQKELPLTGLDIRHRSAASDVKWFNETLFVLGDADLKPVIWRMENGHESITRFGFEQGVNAVSKTSNMQVYNGKLYIGGNQRRLANGNMVYNAGYWTIDQEDNMEFHVVEDELGYALCFSISVSDKGIFLVGEAGTADHAVPAVWSAGGRMPASGLFNSSTQRLHSAITDSKGNLYLNVFDIQHYQPVIWKLPPTGDHELIRATIPADAKGFCQSLDMLNDQLAYTYAYQQNGQIKAAYVFNGKTVALDVYNNMSSNINTVKILSR